MDNKSFQREKTVCGSKENAEYKYFLFPLNFSNNAFFFPGLGKLRIYHQKIKKNLRLVEV